MANIGIRIRTRGPPVYKSVLVGDPNARFIVQSQPEDSALPSLSPTRKDLLAPF